MPDRGKLLLTRPLAQARSFAQSLDGIEVLISPLMKVEPVGQLPDLSNIGALAFTSANGVKAFADLSDRRDLPAFCVGNKTAKCARASGLKVLSADGDVHDLTALIDSHRGAFVGGVLHVSGRDSAGDLSGGLIARGIPACRAVLYQAQALGLNDAARAALGAGDVAAVALFSPRSARLFADALGELPPPPLAICMSTRVSAEIRRCLPVETVVAQHPDAPSMRRAIVSALPKN